MNFFAPPKPRMISPIYGYFWMDDVIHVELFDHIICIVL